MAQKLWEKNVQVNAEIDRFTVGRDREMDMYLAKYDVLGSMAHITMLESIGLLTSDELQGDVPNVVFPCAALQDGERVAVYYGAADTVVGMAFGYIKEIIDFTKRTSII